MIGFQPLPEGRFPGLRINRAAEFAGMASVAQLELLTRTLLPAFRDEFAGLVADEALLILWEEATAPGALKPEVFCRPSDAIARLVGRMRAALPADGGGFEVFLFHIHGWPYLEIRPAGQNPEGDV